MIWTEEGAEPYPWVYRCPYCSTKKWFGLQEDFKFCPYCGQKLEESL